MLFDFEDVKKNYENTKEKYKDSITDKSGRDFKYLLRSKLPWLKQEYKFGELISTYCENLLDYYKYLSFVIHPNEISMLKFTIDKQDLDGLFVAIFIFIILLSLILTSCINTNKIIKDIYEYSPSYNKEYHYNQCECGEIKDKEVHTFTKEIIYSPTCEAEGKSKYTCSCGYSYEETIEALRHKQLTVNGTLASCANTGLSDDLVCETCGKT